MTGSGPDWDTSLLLHVRGLTGTEVPIMVGMINTSRGRELGMRVGPNGRTVILTPQEGLQLVDNLEEMVAVKVRTDRELEW